MQTKICAFLAILISLGSVRAKAADVLTPGFLKVSLYTNITGTAVSGVKSVSTPTKPYRS